MKRVLAVAACLWLPCPLAAQTDEPFGLPLLGEAAEAFLRTAKVVEKNALKVGITRSQRYTLTDGTRSAHALWKTIDKSKPGVTNFEGGGLVVDFADSWKHEVASYELDKLVGTGLVPPTVEIAPPDTEAWNKQMYGVRLLHQLTFNTDPLQGIEHALATNDLPRASSIP